MGKRSNFERKEKDFYPTPLEAVKPLVPFLRPGTRFIEPCAGEGHLVKHLEGAGMKCGGWFDLYDVNSKIDATITTYNIEADYFITNPPWSRNILHPIIENLSKQLPTWLLIDADWMHTKQAVPYLEHCNRILSIGRVKWIPDSKHTGKDNCCWYLFSKLHRGPTELMLPRWRRNLSKKI